VARGQPVRRIMTDKARGYIDERVRLKTNLQFYNHGRALPPYGQAFRRAHLGIGFKT